MKVYIDFSLMSETGAFGRVHGDIELAIVPRSGDTISLSSGKGNRPLPQIRNFPYTVKVDHAILQAGSEEILISCGNVIVSSKDEALKVADYLEKELDLYFDDYDPE